MYHPPWTVTSSRAGHGASLQLHRVADRHGQEESNQCLLEDQTASDDMQTEFRGLDCLTE